MWCCWWCQLFLACIYVGMLLLISYGYCHSSSMKLHYRRWPCCLGHWLLCRMGTLRMCLLCCCCLRWWCLCCRMETLPWCCLHCQMLIHCQMDFFFFPLLPYEVWDEVFYWTWLFDDNVYALTSWKNLNESSTNYTPSFIGFTDIAKNKKMSIFGGFPHHQALGWPTKI